MLLLPAPASPASGMPAHAVDPLAAHVIQCRGEIRDAYVDQPTLCLTFPQVRRLWSLPHEICLRALRDLLDEGFLVQTQEGHYVRPGHLPIRLD
jgi:hypothetical protein